MPHPLQQGRHQGEPPSRELRLGRSRAAHSGICHALAAWLATPDRKAAEVVTKYIIVDMYAKAIQGMAADDAVRWAAEELVKIYR